MRKKRANRATYDILGSNGQHPKHRMNHSEKQLQFLSRKYHVQCWLPW